MRATMATPVTAVGLAVAGIPAAAAETVGPVRITKGAAIEVGGYRTLSGPDIEA